MAALLQGRLSLPGYCALMRNLHAVYEALEAGLPIQAIAFDLGYSSASAFIAMFQRQARCTPEQYRRQARAGH